MTGKTTIEWTHMPGFEGDVWNPTTGCTRVSDGCDNCYAFTLHDKRYASNAEAAATFLNAHDQSRLLNPAPAPRDLATWGRVNGVPMPWPKQYDLPFSRVQLLPERLDAPLRKRKPTCYFVDSMADLFHEDVPDEFIDRVWSTMHSAYRHRFLILTKRPERMREYLSRFKRTPAWDDFVTRDGVPSNESKGAAIFMPTNWPLQNVWIGTSVEDQAAADDRIPHLLATPAEVRFLSCEPLLGPVNLYLGGDDHPGVGHLFLHWVIVGGESGARARPMQLAWVRSLHDQCVTAGVSLFVKQLGSNPHARTVAFEKVDEGFAGGWTTVPIKLRESHGRDPDEWPADLRVRTWPR